MPTFTCFPGGWGKVGVGSGTPFHKLLTLFKCKSKPMEGLQGEMSPVPELEERELSYLVQKPSAVKTALSEATNYSALILFLG